MYGTKKILHEKTLPSVCTNRIRVENTQLQDEKKRSEILIQHLLENLQALESEEQESTSMSGDKRYLVVRWIYALFGLVLTPDFYSDIYDFTQIFCRYLLKNWDLWSGQSRVQLMFFPQQSKANCKSLYNSANIFSSKFTQCTMRFRKRGPKMFNFELLLLHGFSTKKL